ncbi:MAG: pyridoxal phosphate-dependent aminotransferase [Thermodesulfobacteriota bacterium]|nr:pyridoxal phosphate-dependent aminotransferase [Thermodesulfobacteriota bacterium]
MKISKTVTNIPASPTLAITAKVAEMRSQGKEIIGFGAGEPDFDTPEDIKVAAIDALESGQTKYTPVAGIPKIRQAVCDTIKKDYGIDYSMENVIVSCGAKHSLFNLFQTLFDAGDEVICPAPYWVSYPPMIEISGAKPVIVDTTLTGMKLTADMVEDAITKKTRGIIINSPCNPSGMIYERKEMEKIAELCLKHDIIIISDDIYEKLIFNKNEFFSMATISPEVAAKTFIIHGASKTFSMTGWRVGYCIGDAGVIKAMSRLQSQSTSNPTSFAQIGALKSLTANHDRIIEERRVIFERRRDIMVSKLREIPGFDITSPEGAFYCFPCVQEHMDRFASASGLAEYLIENANVAVVPGEGFGAANYMRLSFATSEKNIINGLGQIKDAIEKL